MPGNHNFLGKEECMAYYAGQKLILPMEAH